MPTPPHVALAQQQRRHQKHKQGDPGGKDQSVPLPGVSRAHRLGALDADHNLQVTIRDRGKGINALGFGQRRASRPIPLLRSLRRQEQRRTCDAHYRARLRRIRENPCVAFRAHHGNQTVAGEIDLAIETGERLRVVGGGDHAGKPAVGGIQTADEVDLPCLGHLPARERTREHPVVIVRERGLMAEVVPPADVRSDDRGAGAGTHDPLCVGDEQLQRNIAEHDRLSGPGGQVEMRRVALPFIFEDAQGLIDRQQFASQMLLECLGLAEDLCLHTRRGLYAVGQNGVAHAEPGQRNKRQRRYNDRTLAEQAHAAARHGMTAALWFSIAIDMRPLPGIRRPMAAAHRDLDYVS